MTTDRFDDEQLSDVLDGVADEGTAAAVRADPAAAARLAQLQNVQNLVAAPPPPATPERRSQSIAAALAEATTAPEVASLAPARQARAERRRIPTQWIAVAAAAIVAILAVPFLSQLGDDDADTATSSVADAVESDDRGTQSFGADEAGDAGDATTDATTAEAEPAADGAGDDAAMAEESAAVPSADAESADEAAADDVAATTTTVAAARSIQTVSNTTVLLSFVEGGIIGPQFVITDPEIVLNVNATCLEPFADDSTEAFGLARLAPPGQPERTILVYFGSDSPSLLDGEDCSPIG